MGMSSCPRVCESPVRSLWTNHERVSCNPAGSLCHDFKGFGLNEALLLICYEIVPATQQRRLGC